MPKVFISYRRDDSEPVARRLHSDLTREVFLASEVFRDEETIPGGARFTEEIREALQQCDVVLALIGRHWVSERLHDPEDILAGELRFALDHRKLVIPVLIDGAVMPSSDVLPEALAELSQRQACTLRESTWEKDVRRLLALVGKQLYRSRRTHQFAALAFGFLVALAAWWTGLFDRIGWLELVDQTVRNAFTEGIPRDRLDENLAVIYAPDYDEESDEVLAQWRRKHTRLINGLSQVGAKVVALDVLFERSLARDKAGNVLRVDDSLAQAIWRARRSGTAVVVGVKDRDEPTLIDVLQDTLGDGGWGVIELMRSEITDTALEFELGRSDPRSTYDGRKTYLRPTLPLRAFLHFHGTTGAYFAEGRVHLESPSGERTHSLAAEVAYDRSFSPPRTIFFSHLPEVTLTELQEESYAYHQVLDDLDQIDDFQSKVGELEEKFRDRIVVVGFEDQSDQQKDITGAGPVYGFQLHAMAIAALLGETDIRPLSVPATVLFFLVLAALGVAWHERQHRFLWAYSLSRRLFLHLGSGLIFLLVGVGVVGGVYFVVGLALFSLPQKILLTPVDHLSAFVLAYVALLSYHMNKRFRRVIRS